MKRAVALLLLVALAGCRAPMPSANMFRPLGQTRVPPPGTNGINSSGAYYSPSAPATTTPTIGTGFRPKPINRWSNLDPPEATRTNQPAVAAGNNSKSQVIAAEDLDVALTSHQAVITAPATNVIERNGPIRIGQASTARVVEPLRLRGMPVGGATSSQEPRTFVPQGRVVDINELPDAPVTSSTSTAVTANPATRSNSSSATKTADGWRSKSAADL